MIVNPSNVFNTTALSESEITLLSVWYVTYSSARTSHFADVIKTQRQLFILRTLKCRVLIARCLVRSWPIQEGQCGLLFYAFRLGKGKETTSKVDRVLSQYVIHEWENRNAKFREQDVSVVQTDFQFQSRNTEMQNRQSPKQGILKF
jgi:hypothetical protein